MFNFFRRGKTEYVDCEYCPNCEANLTLQKGYSNDLPRWVCKGCGQMLINPEIDTESNITWICDKCEATLNKQPGFTESCGEWKCTECGFVNKIVPEEVYVSESEYQADIRNPYNGLSDDEILELSLFEDIATMGDKENIILTKNTESGRYYVKKLLYAYDKSIYDYLKDHPAAHMSRICSVYESNNCLIVIEEYIEGRTVADMLEDGTVNDTLGSRSVSGKCDEDITVQGSAVQGIAMHGNTASKQESGEVTVKPLDSLEVLHIAISICDILKDLHGLPTPIVHRDIKPSNVMITFDGEVYLLDMNVAKWYDPDKTDDTRYMGTQFYAAPEQVGYGLSASSAKSDIYALGMLLNVMLTGKFPKEEKAPGQVWNIIEKCISLDADNRYTAEELKAELEGLLV